MDEVLLIGLVVVGGMFLLMSNVVRPDEPGPVIVILPDTTRSQSSGSFPFVGFVILIVLVLLLLS